MRIEEELPEVGVGAGGGARVGGALDHRMAERRPFPDIVQGPVELGEVEAVGAVHGVPAHGLRQRVARADVVLLDDVGEGERRVEAVEGGAHLHEPARVALDAAVRQALEGVSEAEVLHVVGGPALGVDVLLGELDEPLQKRGGSVVVAGGQIALGLGDIAFGNG